MPQLFGRHLCFSSQLLDYTLCWYSHVTRLTGLLATAEMLDEEAAEVGVRVGGGGCADWWLGAIDLLVRTSTSQGANVADHIKEQLMERDRYQSQLPYQALHVTCHWTCLGM